MKSQKPKKSKKMLYTSQPIRPKTQRYKHEFRQYKPNTGSKRKRNQSRTPTTANQNIWPDPKWKTNASSVPRNKENSKKHTDYHHLSSHTTSLLPQLPHLNPMFNFYYVRRKSFIIQKMTEPGRIMTAIKLDLSKSRHLHLTCTWS